MEKREESVLLSSRFVVEWRKQDGRGDICEAV